MNPDPIPTFRQRCADEPVLHLPGDGMHADSCHRWRVNEINAITLALAACRPLLVAGEPGTGKTQLARACAVALGWHLHLATLTARTETADLLYQFDAVQRLADAHGKDLKPSEHYWQPQALWQAIDWEGAHGYGVFAQRPKPETPLGHVVLLDEIDKAPSDVPNSLLDVLGERRFQVPGLNITVCGKQEIWPLIIATTNREKELPEAFVRRCVVLNHSVPQAQYEEWLLQYGQAHFGLESKHGVRLQTDILQEAAWQLALDRQQAKAAQVYAPGLAEYLDLLHALHKIAPGQPEQQKEWLQQLGQFVYRKDTSAAPPPALRQEEQLPVQQAAQAAQTGQAGGQV